MLKQTQLLCLICTVCEQRALVYHGPQLPHMHLSLGFLHADVELRRRVL